MTERNIVNISRLNTFLRNAAEDKRLKEGITLTSLYHKVGGNFIRMFMESTNDSREAARHLMIYTDTKVWVHNGHHGYSVECHSIDDIVEAVRQYAKDYIKSHLITKTAFCQLIKVNWNTYLRYEDRTNNSRPITNKIIDRLGLKIKCLTPYDIEAGAKSRHKRKKKSNISAEKRRNTRALMNDDYVSEYKKEILERMKKLWP